MKMPITKQSSSADAGDIKPWPASSAPSGWLKCNGAAVSRSLYAALFNIIGTTYGAGDGSTTFNLPDLRGEFLRGLDDGRGVDSGRTIGTAQAHQNAAHQHYVAWQGNTGSATNSSNLSSTAYVAGSTGPSSLYEGYGLQQTANVANAGLSSSAGGTETRPRNVSALWIIKY
jgi:microcystin-dependent protein